MKFRFPEEDYFLLCRLIYEKEGFDLRFFKRSIVERKILKRLGVYGIKTLRDYLKFLEKPEEREIFLKSLLIGVTSFMRNYDVYECFARRALKEILSSRENEDEIKIMSIGCSTGEEVYSIVFSIVHFWKEDVVKRVIVLGVDMNDEAIKRAREGIYSFEELKGLPQEWVERFFFKEKENGYYRVKDELREACKFYTVNVLKEDLPEREWDAIFLRNFLIFFSAEGKRIVLGKVEEVLKVNGFLVLGKAETGFCLKELKYNYYPFCLEHRVFLKGGER